MQRYATQRMSARYTLQYSQKNKRTTRRTAVLSNAEQRSATQRSAAQSSAEQSSAAQC
jgi:hypothetical protein